MVTDVLLTQIRVALKGLNEASDALDVILDELCAAGIEDLTLNTLFAEVEAWIDMLMEVEGEYANAGDGKESDA